MDNINLLANDIAGRMRGLNVAIDAPMKSSCSFRIGGTAAALSEPRSEREFIELLEHLNHAGVRPLIIGNGTNLLITDGHINRFVVKTTGLTGISRKGDSVVYAEAGVLLSKLAVTVGGWGLSGMEFAHGIPGTLGGAVTMNAGAYGGEMKDVVLYTDFLDESCKGRRMADEEQDFSYRHSVFSDSDYVVLGSSLKLKPGDPEEITQTMRQLSKKRGGSQPLNVPSAGSTFKRPAQGYAAALIDEGGLKGYSIGGAQVSTKHAGFVVNNGDASFNDVIKLMSHIRRTVLEMHDIELEPEVRVVGEDGFMSSQEVLALMEDVWNS